MVSFARDELKRVILAWYGEVVNTEGKNFVGVGEENRNDPLVQLAGPQTIRVVELTNMEVGNFLIFDLNYGKGVVALS